MGTQKLGKGKEVSACYVSPPAQFDEHGESETLSFWPLPCFPASSQVYGRMKDGGRGVVTPLRKQTDQKGKARHSRDWEGGFREVGGRIGDFISRSLGKCT